MSEIRNYKHIEPVPKNFSAWKIHSDVHCELVRVQLLPGESIEKHVNEKTVFFYVLEGRGTLTSGAEELVLQQEDSIRIEKGMERSWSNDGDGPLVILVIKQL